MVVVRFRSLTVVEVYVYRLGSESFFSFSSPMTTIEMVSQKWIAQSQHHAPRICPLRVRARLTRAEFNLATKLKETKEVLEFNLGLTISSHYFQPHQEK